MRNLVFLLLVILIGCNTRSTTTEDAGWRQITIPVADDVKQRIQDSIPPQYYNKNQEYNYFALRFLRPMSNGEMPVVVETLQGGQEWVRLFAFRDDRLRFITEVTGEVTKAESDSVAGTIRLSIDKTSTIVLVNCSTG